MAQLSLKLLLQYQKVLLLALARTRKQSREGKYKLITCFVPKDNRQSFPTLIWMTYFFDVFENVCSSWSSNALKLRLSKGSSSLEAVGDNLCTSWITLTFWPSNISRILHTKCRLKMFPSFFSRVVSPFHFALI